MKLGARTFEFFDAPGHAKHHHCPVDLDIHDVYAGDNFGICYRDLDTAAGPFMLPTTTPVQFEPEALHRTIDRLMSYRPRRSCRRTSVRSLISSGWPGTCIPRSTNSWASRVGMPRPPTARAGSGRTCSTIWTGAWTRTAIPVTLATRHRLIDADVELNSQGLEVWLSRQ